MDSIISLGVGNFEIDWGKNDVDRNHSCLFLSSDRTIGPYFYAGDDEVDDTSAVQKPVYARCVGSVKRRLELLGYTLDSCRGQFGDQRTFHFRHADSNEHEALTFDRFASVICSVDVSRLRIPGPPDTYDFGEYAARCILSDPEFHSLGMKEHDLRWVAGEFLDNVDPYVILRLLAENPVNLDRPVMWRYHDVVEGGYVEESSIYEGLNPDQQILVVTEGSTDSHILKRSLACKFSEVEDFFFFIDMTDNYPFTGTGNLYRFVQGLTAIRHRQRTLVVLDNDTAGNETAKKLGELRLPANIAVCVLPNLDECKTFGTVGPSGSSTEDINGRACSIELFLDLRFEMEDEPVIRWTSYNTQMDQYQGELQGKDNVTRAFLKEGWRSNAYRWSKLIGLWDYLFEHCKRT